MYLKLSKSKEEFINLHNPEIIQAAEACTDERQKLINKISPKHQLQKCWLWVANKQENIAAFFQCYKTELECCDLEDWKIEYLKANQYRILLSTISYLIVPTIIQHRTKRSG